MLAIFLAIFLIQSFFNSSYFFQSKILAILPVSDTYIVYQFILSHIRFLDQHFQTKHTFVSHKIQGKNSPKFLICIALVSPDVLKHFDEIIQLQNIIRIPHEFFFQSYTPLQYTFSITPKGHRKCVILESLLKQSSINKGNGMIGVSLIPTLSHSLNFIKSLFCELHIPWSFSPSTNIYTYVSFPLRRQNSRALEEL